MHVCWPAGTLPSPGPSPIVCKFGETNALAIQISPNLVEKLVEDAPGLIKRPHSALVVYHYEGSVSLEQT